MTTAAPAFVVSDENLHLDLMKEVYRLFDFINSHYALELGRPVITLVHDPKKKASGWFSHDVWVTADKKMHELNISSEALAKGFLTALEILTHEVAHLKNFVVAGNKIVDCSDQQRHNKIFKDRAISLGLDVTSSTRFGPAHTTLTPAWEKVIATKFKPDLDVFNLYRDRFNGTKKKDKKPTKLTPVIVSNETKAAIVAGAEALGMSQKDFAGAAVKTFVEMPVTIEHIIALITARVPIEQDWLRKTLQDNLIYVVPAKAPAPEE